MAEAYAVKDGKTKLVDYTGKDLIIPGCTEGHGHFIGLDGVERMLPGYREPYSKLFGSIIGEKMKTNPGPFLSFGGLTCKYRKSLQTIMPWRSRLCLKANLSFSWTKVVTVLCATAPH